MTDEFARGYLAERYSIKAMRERIAERREVEMTEDMTEEADAIRRDHKKNTAELVDRIRGVSQLIEEARAKGQATTLFTARRAELAAQLRQADVLAQTALREWHRKVAGVALAEFDSDPVGDAAAESRRVADEMEIRRLSDRIGTKAKADGYLAQARRHLAAGNPERARVYLEAARAQRPVGISAVELEVTKALGEKLPHRRAALRMVDAARRTLRDFEADRLETARDLRIGVTQHGDLGTGEPGQAARASVSAKVRSWERSREDGTEYREQVQLGGQARLAGDPRD